MTTPNDTITSNRGRNEFRTIASEGMLMGGSVMRRAAAGPTATPSASIACTMGTSPAVGITKRAPALANTNIQIKESSTSWPMCGKSQARTAPNARTSTRYSGIKRMDIRYSTASHRAKETSCCCPTKSASGFRGTATLASEPAR